VVNVHDAAKLTRPTLKYGRADAQVIVRLREMLIRHQEITSQAAQAALGLEAGVLRAAFQALMQNGEVTTSGARRGTVYHWVTANAARTADVPADTKSPAATAAPPQEEAPRTPLPRQASLF
jgi:hypothetical protein